MELVVLRYRDAEQPYVGLQEAALCALRSQVRGATAGRRAGARAGHLTSRRGVVHSVHTPPLAPPLTPRAQLLMALHDLGETELCTREGCHKLAWTLDACLKVSMERMGCPAGRAVEGSWSSAADPPGAPPSPRHHCRTGAWTSGGCASWPTSCSRTWRQRLGEPPAWRAPRTAAAPASPSACHRAVRCGAGGVGGPVGMPQGRPVAACSAHPFLPSTRAPTRLHARPPALPLPAGAIDNDAESAGAPGASHAEEPHQARRPLRLPCAARQAAACAG